jgi:hypothetical protein
MTPTSLALYALFGLIAVVLLSAFMLMASVKWSEGYRYSFGDALKLTLLTLVGTTVAQVVASLVLTALLGSSIAATLFSTLVSLLVVAGVSIWLYAQRISSPGGEPIGVKRAIKVTVYQSVILFGVLLVLAFVALFMAQQGWITMPSLESLGITVAVVTPGVGLRNL